MEKDTNLALDGYDPLTFFEGDKPRRGKFDIKAKVDGKVFCFCKPEHKGRFVRNSHSFLPQFGGHCAFLCGLYGGLTPGKPELYQVRGGKLYLFSSPLLMTWWDKFPKLVIWGHKNYEKKFKIKIKTK